MNICTCMYEKVSNLIMAAGTTLELSEDGVQLKIFPGADKFYS